MASLSAAAVDKKSSNIKSRIDAIKECPDGEIIFGLPRAHFDGHAPTVINQDVRRFFGLQPELYTPSFPAFSGNPSDRVRDQLLRASSALQERHDQISVEQDAIALATEDLRNAKEHGCDFDSDIEFPLIQMVIEWLIIFEEKPYHRHALMADIEFAGPDEEEPALTQLVELEAEED